MVVKDSPAHGSLLHDQGERTAGSDRTVSHQHETSSDQRESGCQGSNLDLLKMQAIAMGSGSKPRRVILPDEVEAMTCPAAVHKRGRALGRVVGDERVEVTPVPVGC